MARYLTGSQYFCQFDRWLRMPQRMPLMEDVFILPSHLTSHVVVQLRSSSKHVGTNKGLTVDSTPKCITYVCFTLYKVFSKNQQQS